MSPDGPTYKRASAGARARAAGEAFEDRIEYSANRYLANDRALIQRNGTRCQRRGEKWIPLRSVQDWTGAHLPTRVAFAFETKSVGDETASFALDPKDPTMFNQATLLTDWHLAGLPAFILCEVRPTDSIYVLPWTYADPFVRHPIAFNPLGRCDAFGEDYVAGDWLSVVERLYKLETRK